MLVTLEDGTRVRLRRIRPDDKDGLARGLAALSEASVRHRFLAPKQRFTRAELEYLTEVDGAHHVAYVALLDRDPERLVASGRWIRDPEQPDRAEFAIVVADELQGRGLGSALAERLSRDAREAGIRRLTATVLAENEPIRRLIARIAGHLTAERGHEGAGRLTTGEMHGGVEELVLDLAA